MATINDAITAAANGRLAVQRGPGEVTRNAKSCQAEETAEECEPEGALCCDNLNCGDRRSVGRGFAARCVCDGIEKIQGHTDPTEGP